MSNKVEAKTLPGMMELLPNEQVLFNKMMDTIRKVYEQYGFLPLDTPVVELSDVLLAKAGGETEKQIYRFTKGDNDLSLRFDLTVPLAKYVAINYNNLAFPFRRYQLGKVYRGERPQKGRYREFYQCDIDIIGDGELNIINDAELPKIIYTIFKELDIGDFTIYINNRKILNGLFEDLGLVEEAPEVMRIIDKLDKIGLENVILTLKDLNISEEKINSIVDFINITGSNNEKLDKLNKLGINNEIFNEGLNELTQVVKYMRLFELPENNFEINLKIARGLDYYTGTVYETFLNEYRNIGSICSGGRYDNLAEYYTKQKLPGVGISIGFTRLFYQLNELGIIKENKKSVSDVLVMSMDENIDKCIEVANELRSQEINAQVYFDNKKIKAKIKYAERLNIKYIIIIGEEERQTNILTLKNIETGQQEKVTIEEISKRIK
ncbi:MAG: histidine--tRNA ligase [Clostridiales bacterium]|nr:histidine--tRNA ligase [Clostridiales bacterium]